MKATRPWIILKSQHKHCVFKRLERVKRTTICVCTCNGIPYHVRVFMALLVAITITKTLYKELYQSIHQLAAD